MLLSRDVLPGFEQTKISALKAVYGESTIAFDKSPKGSVDYPIRSLVDLMNKHPRYATTSSCSGRIAIFDPSAIENNITGTEGSGKGGGKWLISAHRRITVEELRGILDSHESQSALMFKHEPMLLHIACASMYDAMRLLRVGIDHGMLRESGSIVTDKRITVALRGHALALTVPIAAKGPLRPSDEYLTMLVKEANERFRRNEENLKRLYHAIESNIFIDEYRGLLTRKCGDQILHAEYNRLPSLNLWGHTSVLVHYEDRDDYDTEVIIFGGYGNGPLNIDESFKGKCERKSNIFSLRRKGYIWENSWREISSSTSNSLENYIHCSKQSFPPVQGHRSCVLPLKSISSKIIAIFGGRASPACPKSDLYLYDCSNSTCYLANTQGKHPTSRWGHTFTELPCSNGNLAIVVGGRNDYSVLDSVYVLSVCYYPGEKLMLQWDMLDFKVQLFNHTTVLQPNAGSPMDKLLCFGGLKTLNCISTDSVITCSIVMSEAGYKFELVEQQDLVSYPCFAASSSTISCNESRCPFFIISGGLSIDETYASSVFNLCECRSENNIVTHNVTIEESIFNDDIKINKDLLVHHDTKFLMHGNEFEILLLGGGVDGFAFGPIFSECFSIKLRGFAFGSAINANHKEENSSTESMSYKKQNSIHTCECDVLYVNKKNAKSVKIQLERGGFLHKDFRISPTKENEINDHTLHVSIPVTSSFIKWINTLDDHDQPDWFLSDVVSRGKTNAPYSTRVLGKK